VPELFTEGLGGARRVREENWMTVLMLLGGRAKQRSFGRGG